MGKIAIEFQNISKQYALGSIGTGTLSRDLNRWWARIRGKEDPASSTLFRAIFFMIPL